MVRGRVVGGTLLRGAHLMPRVPSKLAVGSPSSAQDFNDLIDQHRAGMLGQVQGSFVERHGSATLVHGRRPIGQRVVPAVEFAFRVAKAGALAVRVTGGSAQMVGETAREYATQTLTVPSVDGTYVVLGRNNYGFGDEEGTWDDLTVCLLADIPAVVVDGRLIAENFRIATLVVADGRLSGKPVQNWLWGDLRGYAPNLAPEEAPAP